MIWGGDKLERKLLCTHPQTAAHLMAQGHECVEIPSPFRDGCFAWEFDADEELVKKLNIITVELDYKKYRAKGGDNG